MEQKVIPKSLPSSQVHSKWRSVNWQPVSPYKAMGAEMCSTSSRCPGNSTEYKCQDGIVHWTLTFLSPLPQTASQCKVNKKYFAAQILGHKDMEWGQHANAFEIKTKFCWVFVKEFLFIFVFSSVEVIINTSMEYLLSVEQANLKYHLPWKHSTIGIQ